MFTGIIRNIARVAQVLPANPYKIFFHQPQVAKEVKIGDSISISGCCLTITEIADDSFAVDIALETLKKTTIQELREGDFVNIELAMQAMSRFDGHIVQGHVDQTGKIVEIMKEPDSSITIWIETLPDLLDHMVEKGSVTVDGVSLTVIDVTPSRFSFMLIPLTQKHTTLGSKKVGSLVNIETDILAKYVKKLCQKNFV